MELRSVSGVEMVVIGDKQVQAAAADRADNSRGSESI
jgi:hypothetical protein